VILILYPTQSSHIYIFISLGESGSSVIKALCYKPKGRGFEFFKTLGFTQPLTEMSTGNIIIIMFLGSKVRQVRRADNLTII
jgi:hypothetical protein